MQASPTEPERPVPALVTLHLWRVRWSAAPRAVARVAGDRGRVRREPGVRFAKVLGTGTGLTFTPADADPTRWGLLVCWADGAAAARFQDSPVVLGWRRLAVEEWRVDLVPLASHGRWAGTTPFGAPEPRRTDGPVAAVTRGRIRPSRTADFWRSSRQVAETVRDAPGLRLAVGIGEAPVGLQGTFSLWESHRALRHYAYRDPAHRDVTARTRDTGWYAEDLFARFAVVGSAGTVDGRDPLAPPR